jgi:hypothetical protein
MRSERAPRAWLLAFLLALGPSRPGAPAEVVEAILAVVQERPILLSEVRVVQEIRGLGREPALEALIDERLMFEQAARLPQSAMSDVEIDRGVAGLLASKPALAGRVAESDLRRLVRRQGTILKFVEFRFRPQVRVPDGLPAEERDAEVRRALDERIEAWVKELRAGAEIRYPRRE